MRWFCWDFRIVKTLLLEILSVVSFRVSRASSSVCFSLFLSWKDFVSHVNSLRNLLELMAESPYEARMANSKVAFLAHVKFLVRIFCSFSSVKRA